MANKKDHGGKENDNTTTFIYKLMKNIDENTLPDQLLSPDSEVKKKRDNKRFFDELWVATIIASVRIYESIIAFLEAQRKKSILEYEKYIDRHKAAKPLFAQLITNPNGIKILLTTTQLEKAKMIQHKFKLIVAKLDAKIDELNAKIKIQRQDVLILQEKSDQARINFSNHFLSYVERRARDPDFQSMTIPISLPDQYRDLPFAREYNGYIDIEREVYLEITREVGNELLYGTLEINQFTAAIDKKFTDLLRNNVDKYWPFLEKNSHATMIAQLQDSINKNVFSIHYLNDARNEPELIQTFIEGCKAKSDYLQTVAKLEENNKFVDELSAGKDMILDQLNNLEHIEEQYAENLLQGSDLINNYLQNLDDLADNLGNDLDHLESVNHETIKTIESASTEAASLLQKCSFLMEKSDNFEMDPANTQQDKMLDLLSSLLDKSNEFTNSHSILLESGLEEPSNHLLDSDEEDRPSYSGMPPQKG